MPYRAPIFINVLIRLKKKKFSYIFFLAKSFAQNLIYLYPDINLDNLYVSMHICRASQILEDLSLWK